MLLAFKDNDMSAPVATYALTSTSSDPADVRAWLHANRFPSAFELSRDVFQQVMYAPHHPLVLIVATPRARQEAVSTKLTEVAQKWRLGAVAGRDVVFTWMDAEQWTKWLKDMYGIKVASEPVIVVADHQVSGVPSRCASLMVGSGWCTMTGTDRGMRLRSTR